MRRNPVPQPFLLSFPVLLHFDPVVGPADRRTYCDHDDIDQQMPAVLAKGSTATAKLTRIVTARSCFMFALLLHAPAGSYPTSCTLSAIALVYLVMILLWLRLPDGVVGGNGPVPARSTSLTAGCCSSTRGPSLTAVCGKCCASPWRTQSSPSTARLVK